MKQRGRLIPFIPVLRRTPAQPAEDGSVIDPAPSPDSSAMEEAGEVEAAQWGLLQRILFRIAFTYIFLYHFPFRSTTSRTSSSSKSCIRRSWT